MFFAIAGAVYIPVVPARGGAEAALGLCYKTFLIYRTCMRRAPARPMRACFVRQRCVVPKVALETPHFTLHSSHFTLRTYTSHSTLHLISSHLNSSHLISANLFSSHLIFSQLVSFHLSTAQPFSIHRSSSQLISALLHIKKFLLSKRSLMHTKAIARRKLCTQKLETPMRLHRKVFTHRKPLHIRSFYTQSRSTLLHRNFTQRSLLHTEASTHSKLLHTEKLLYAANFYTQQTFTHKQFLQSFARAKYFFTPQVFTHSTLLHRETFSHSKLLHTEAFTHTARFYTKKLLHTANVYTEKFLHKKIFMQRNFYKEKPLKTDALTHGSFYTEKLYTQKLLRTEPCQTCLHKALTSTTSYCKVPVRLCTTKLAQSTAQY